MMVALENTYQTMQLNLEKKCAYLEGQLSTKDNALDSAEDKLQTAKENVASVFAKKDKQSSDPMSFQNANEDLKV